MTEILIVIVLIILIIALAIPAFNAITGTRSVDAGENLVSAMVSLGRAEAIRTKKMAGVAFFRDTRTERTTMAIVVSAADRQGSSTEPPGLEQYKSWREFQEDGTTPVRYEPGDVVIALLNDTDVTPNKKTTQLFICGQGHDADAASNKPPTSPYWVQLNASELDTLVGYDYQYLPTGVGLQTINDPDPTNVGVMRDRYLRRGLILFDGDGNLLHKPYTILWPGALNTDETRLFHVMGFDNRAAPLNQTDVGTQTPAYPIYSQLGVVLYDDQEYKNAGYNDDDPLNDNQPMGGAEPGEESWLDQNSLSLMVNRYNGTLVRGE